MEIFQEDANKTITRNDLKLEYTINAARLDDLCFEILEILFQEKENLQLKNRLLDRFRQINFFILEIIDPVYRSVFGLDRKPDITRDIPLNHSQEELLKIRKASIDLIVLIEAIKVRLSNELVIPENPIIREVQKYISQDSIKGGDFELVSELKRMIIQAFAGCYTENASSMPHIRLPNELEQEILINQKLHKEEDFLVPAGPKESMQFRMPSAIQIPSSHTLRDHISMVSSENIHEAEIKHSPYIPRTSCIYRNLDSFSEDSSADEYECTSIKIKEVPVKPTYSDVIQNIRRKAMEIEYETKARPRNIQKTGSGSEVSDSPLDEQTNSPLSEHTNSPSSEETNSPLSEETNSPLSEETNSPLSEVSDSPLSEGTNSPVYNQTNSPVYERTNSPVYNVTSTPLTTPVYEVTNSSDSNRNVSPVYIPVYEETKTPVYEQTNPIISPDYIQDTIKCPGPFMNEYKNTLFYGNTLVAPRKGKPSEYSILVKKKKEMTRQGKCYKNILFVLIILCIISVLCIGYIYKDILFEYTEYIRVYN
ncbi:uncharacterized protein NESG_01247 [Nematocida ausubeli]|uniref:Uncharacterized protein n=1 Tax=Nematocida ausubeli (strain ATCC PRA-371 / ERTm2) TaxID=1913371 RepID=A0A086J1W4_NEMA1|nr:uncharacterized protein NESG_01247 [Nematocida ausubeli]KFG26132.1 hypothetical protein NESG_01247 [Nematocida ausubeli]